MKHTITLIPGDGIGPEVSNAVKQILQAAEVDIQWEETATRAELERRGTDFMQSGVLESIHKNGVALKGPMATAVAGGAPSLNVGLRQALNLYANLRPVKNLEGVQSRYQRRGYGDREGEYRRSLRRAGTHGGARGCREPEDHHRKGFYTRVTVRF